MVMWITLEGCGDMKIRPAQGGQWDLPRLQCAPGILSKSRQFGSSQSPTLAHSTGPLSSSIAL